MTTPPAAGARRAVLAMLALALAAAPARAQFTEVPAPSAYALRNVTLVSASGVRTNGVDVLVRGQRIEAIGPKLALPADAQLLAGDSLLVYPGIVDAWGAVKFAFPRDSVDRARLRSWDPPRAVQGFTPGRRVLDVLDPGASELAELRKKGVIAVAVHPTEGLMPGRGALLLLRTEATSPSALAVQPTLGPVFTFRGARGFYPSTGMAIPSWYRQTFADAQRRAQLAQATPRGGVPPAYDADYAVVQEALAGVVPVFFHADDAEQIRHVLRFADEYRIRPAILGGAEAWQVAAELKRRDVPVVVSLDFPKPRRWKPDAKTPEDSLAPAVVREKRELEAQYANAGRLAAAGVRIALASGGKADIREGARKAIEAGLDSAAALRAVTATPAALFGIDRVAEVGVGQPATFVVTKGTLFGKDAKVVYTFVEGALERGASATGAAKADSAKAGAQKPLTGEWTFEVKAGVGDAVSGDMKLTQEGEKLTGTVTLGEFGIATITNGTIVGDKVNMTLAISAGGQQMNISLTGTVTGDSMSGSGTSPMGPFEWSAVREEGGAR